MALRLPSSDLRSTAVNQLWRLISGPATLLLIPVFLTPELQGYWFTFISLAALAVFADLGFTAILVQFAAHEFAYLQFDERGLLSGDAERLSRMSSLLRFAIRWAVLMSGLVFPLTLVIGVLILSQKSTDIPWFLPWVLYSCAGIMVFLNTTLLSFIEGCNLVGEAQKTRFWISFCAFCAMVLALTSGWGLYALATSMLVAGVAGTFLVLQRYGKIFFDLMKKGSNGPRYPWGGEILPLLGRYAISWGSGYFIFQLFTPIAFAYYAADVAGMVGLSFAIWTAVFTLSNTWMIIITPKINIFVSTQSYSELNTLFFRHLRFSVATFFLGAIVMLALYQIPLVSEFLGARIVSPLSMSILGVAWLIQLIVSSMAIYMRAHKEEPMMYASVLVGLFISLSTWFIAVSFSFELFFVGYLSAYVLLLPWTVWMFNKYRAKND